MASDKFLTKALTHFVLLIGVIISIFPFYWLVVMATNTTSDILRFPPKLTFGHELFTNVKNVLASIDFYQAFLTRYLFQPSRSLAYYSFVPLPDLHSRNFVFQEKTCCSLLCC